MSKYIEYYCPACGYKHITSTPPEGFGVVNYCEGSGCATLIDLVCKGQRFYFVSDAPDLKSTTDEEWIEYRKNSRKRAANES